MPYIQTTNDSRLGRLLRAPTAAGSGRGMLRWRHFVTRTVLTRSICKPLSIDAASKLRAKASEPHDTRDWNEKCMPTIVETVRVWRNSTGCRAKELAMGPHHAEKFRNVRVKWSGIAALVVVVHCLTGCGTKPGAQLDPDADNRPRAAQSPAGGQELAATSREPATGEQLYAQHCAACHGLKGDGKGLAAQFVFPKPRDFRAGRFRLVSTANGVPTFDDIRMVLRRGMPGSSMPPWPQLSDDAVKRLAQHIITLRQEGIRESLVAAATESGDEVSEEDLRDAIDRLTTPGDMVAAVDLGSPTPEVVAHGKELYATKACVQCHGASGKGDGQQQMVDSEGLPTRPRDLTRGIFKGSPDPASVWRRISLGMPGTPMPSSQSLTPKEVADLTHYILSLSNEKAREAAVLTRQRVMVKQVLSLPTAGDSPAWQQVAAFSIRTTPLWWRDDAEPGLSVQAVHDGKTICFRMTWADHYPNQDSGRSEDFEDAIAVELFRGKSEPFLGMGAADAPVDMWFWDADRQSADDIEKVNPNVVVDIYPFNETVVTTAQYDRAGTRTAAQPPISLPALAAGNQIVPSEKTRAASSLETAGPGSSTFRPAKSQLVDAHGQWTEGRWTVVMTRALQVDAATAGVSLEPGARASVAYAIWDGGAKDRDGKKLVSIWQDLELERK
jgi:mono/diheme cytochrome c family protein